MASIDRRTFVKAATAAGMSFATADRKLVSANIMQAEFVYEPGYFGPSSFGHGDIVTIGGSGFGNKSTAPPLVWDDATGPDNILDLWTGANLQFPEDPANWRTAPIRSVSPPHTRVGRYIAAVGTTGNMSFWKRFPFTSGMAVYASCYWRNDPAWTFGGDNNQKNFTYTLAASPNQTPYGNSVSHINYEFNPRATSLTSLPRWHLYSSTGGDDFIADGPPYGENGHQVYSGGINAANPMVGWNKYEFLNVFGASGFIRVYENGRLVIGYTGHTDTWDVSHRLFAFGGFHRPYNNTSNWRYFTDVYLDTSLARIMLIDSPTFNASPTVREMQLPLPMAWSSTEITFSCWQGAHQTLSGVSLYVVKPNNTPLKIGTFL